MDVDFVDGRAIFSPFTAEDDKDPETGKAGVRTHCALIGWILSWFGKAEKLHDDKHNVDFYVNVNSSVRWLDRHGLKDLRQYRDPVIFGSGLLLSWALGDALGIASLTKKIKESPKDHQSFYQRGCRLLSSNWQQAADDFTKAAENAPDDKSKAKYLYCRAECYAKGTVEERLDQAIRDFTEAHTLDPKMINPMDSCDTRVPQERRAALYERMNKFDLAYQDYQDMLKTDPTNEQLQKQCNELIRKLYIAS
jgi:tetratricopeptide (TPR) repeat protein